MEIGGDRRRQFWSYERLAAIGVTVVAVLSPLYIDRREVEDSELDEAPVSFEAWLPILLLVLTSAIGLSLFLDRGLTRFDPYWIHRVGGSSGGILFILLLLALVLKCKASLSNWDA